MTISLFSDGPCNFGIQYLAVGNKFSIYMYNFVTNEKTKPCMYMLFLHQDLSMSHAMHGHAPNSDHILLCHGMCPIGF